MLARVTKKIGSGLALILLATALVSGSALARPLSSSPARVERVLAAPLALPGVADLETFDLCASAGSVTMPDGAVITIWGFSYWSGSACNPATLPGPVLAVDVGDTVTVNLTNNLAEDVLIYFPGQTGVTGGPTPPGGTTSYTFTASNPGTYLYEAGTNTAGAGEARWQVPMGLYGALIVRPLTAGQAYADAGGEGDTAYDVEATLVLSEIDPALNNYAGGPSGYFSATNFPSPVYPDTTLAYAPKYWLINGQPWTPSTTPISALAGQRVLLRYLNAGLVHDTMSLLGAHQRVIAREAFELDNPGFPYEVVAETIPSGQTLDTIVTVPAGAAPGDKFPLYNRQWHLTNGDIGSTPHFPGGMMTFIEVGTPPPPIVTVTVEDTSGTPESGLPVYVFDGATYTGFNDVTNGSGQVTFTLPAGSYRFRADKNGTQFFSGAVNHCTIPGCTAASITTTIPVVVTVSDTSSNPEGGLNVYPFSGATWTGQSGVTAGDGTVSFTLVPGDYNFRADKNGTEFFSGGASGVNTCSIPSVGVICTTDSVTVTDPVVVTVSNTSSVPQPGLNVYPFSGTTWTGQSGVTAGDGTVSFTLVPGDYNFRADVGSSPYFSGGASGVNTCSIPSVGVTCTTDSVTVP